MSRRKGLSFDEKRKRMLDYMMDNKEVYTLSELEKKLPKECGIVQQSVKEVLDSLKYDDLVDYDKIGSGNFFWAFTSKVQAKKTNKLNALESELKSLEELQVNLTSRKRKLEEDSVPCEERTNKLQKLEENKSKISEQEEELKAYSKNDPEKLQALAEATTVAKEAANRWTDNIYVMLKFFKDKKPHLTEVDLLKYFDLYDPKVEFDYIQ